MTQARKPIKWPLIEGPIQLDALSEDDFPLLDTFFRRPQDLYYYVPTLVFPRTPAQLRKMMGDWSDYRRFYTFAIRNHGRLAGLLHIDDVDLINGHAEIGIALTDPEARGQGLAARAIRIMVRYAFEELGLVRITARIMDGNVPSQKLFTGLGFVHEGTMRQFVRRSGSHLDMHIYGLLRSDAASLLAAADSGHPAGQDFGRGD